MLLELKEVNASNMLDTKQLLLHNKIVYRVNRYNGKIRLIY